MAAQDNLIQDKRNKKDQLIKQRRSVREGGISSGGNTRKGELTEKINIVKGIRANKRKQQDLMRELVAQIGNLEEEKRALLKGMNADCRTLEAVH